MAKTLSIEVLKRSVDVWREYNHVQGQAAVVLGISRNSLLHRLRRSRAAGLTSKEDNFILDNPDRRRRFLPESDTKKDRPEPVDDRPVAGGRVEIFGRERAKLTRGVNRFILTSAQNNTHVHPEVWKNLMALRDHYDAAVMVSRYTYNKNSWRKEEKPGTGDDQNNLWHAPEIVPYITDHRVEIAPGLDFCGEQNTLPTAKRPLQGFESYTGRASGIFPHAKFAMESIISGKSEATKFNWTTGTVTMRNYIQKRAGLEAEFHHGYGAVLVEVDKDGDWFVRQLNADSDGTIYDLDVRVKSGKVTTGNRVEAINWGDLHSEKLDPRVREMAFGKGGMLDALQPRYQFAHDLIDFMGRNHHNRGNPHEMFRIFLANRDDVDAAMKEASGLLADMDRDWCSTIVVESNHDSALTRWLREADYRGDPVNALFFLRAQIAVYEAMHAGEELHALEWALRRHVIGDNPRIDFLREDDTFIICPEAGDGIECGMHGHLGPNGARGTPRAFTKMGRKANTGHSHSASIIDGVYTAGVSGVLDMGYNRGPSSWSHSHIVTYPNGKRAIVTMWNGKWCA